MPARVIEASNLIEVGNADDVCFNCSCERRDHLFGSGQCGRCEGCGEFEYTEPDPCQIAECFAPAIDTLHATGGGYPGSSGFSFRVCQSHYDTVTTKAREGDWSMVDAAAAAVCPGCGAPALFSGVPLCRSCQENDLVQLSVWVPRRLRDRLGEFAKSSGETRRAMVTEALERFLP